MQQVLRTKLEQTIATNQLQQFYPPQALQAVLMRLNNVDFRRAPFTGTLTSRLTILLQNIMCLWTASSIAMDATFLHVHS